ncbi:hypothetical protein ACFE04_015923 [Oxalis oulophora]
MSDSSLPTLIFSYGTLKTNLPNYHLMQDLITKTDAIHIGNCTTLIPYPLLIGPYGIPYLINHPNTGHRVKGELYSVTSNHGGLARVDELEGTKRGHYERLPIKVVMEGEEDGVVVEAEAYFANRSYGGEMLEKKKKKKKSELLSEFTEKEAKGYVRVSDRINKGSCILDDIRLFLSS